LALYSSICFYPAKQLLSFSEQAMLCWAKDAEQGLALHPFG
jgi:hypothetical protein